MDQADFYKHQISLTEWLNSMGHADTPALRKEDFTKYDRLELLYQLMGLPYGRPNTFPATAAGTHDPAFVDYVHDHAGDLCMIRLVPHDPGMPKFRMRGKTVAEAVSWYQTQGVDPKQYDIFLVPHTNDHGWGTIMVVNQHGIFGETIHGEHNKLTQGLYEPDEHPITFSSDFSSWQFNPRNAEAEAFVKSLSLKLIVHNASIREQLQDELGAEFAGDYLCGYFETTMSQAHGVWFLDFSPAIGRMYRDFMEKATRQSNKALVKGQTGCPGQATGRVRLVEPGEVATAQLSPGEVLVCRMTTPDYLPLMRQSSAIVTDLGGILSHAAIVARELGKPCLTATRNATTVLQPGQQIIVDADSGAVRAG